MNVGDVVYIPSKDYFIDKYGSISRIPHGNRRTKEDIMGTEQVIYGFEQHGDVLYSVFMVEDGKVRFDMNDLDQGKVPIDKPEKNYVIKKKLIQEI